MTVTSATQICLGGHLDVCDCSIPNVAIFGHTLQAPLVGPLGIDVLSSMLTKVCKDLLSNVDIYFAGNGVEEE